MWNDRGISLLLVDGAPSSLGALTDTSGRVGYYLSEADDVTPLLVATEMQRTLGKQYQIGIVTGEGMRAGRFVTAENVRAQATEFGWVTPPLEVGILLAMQLRPQMMALFLELRGVVVMHEPVLCNDGTRDYPSVLWLRRQRINDDPVSADIPDEHLLSAWRLDVEESPPNNQCPYEMGFAFLVPADGDRRPA